MGYNVLSGSTSMVSWAASGSFEGDGAGLENVIQFPTQNTSATRIPFFKTIDGKTGFNANSNFSFAASTETLSVPTLVASSGITASVGLRLSNPTSGSLAGLGSYLGVDSIGNLIVTSSLNHAQGPQNAIQFHSSDEIISGSGNLTFDGTTLNLTGTMTVTGSILPSGSAVYSLGSPDNRWEAVYLSSGSLHLGTHCSISTDETTSHHSITFNKRVEISGSGGRGEGLTVVGNMIITGSILPSGSAVYSLGSPTNRWDSIHVGTGSVHLGADCTISTSEPVGGHHSITLNKWTEISGSGAGGEGLTVTGSVFPGVTNTFDLGSPTKQWRSLYVSSSTIYFGGESLSVKEGSLKFGSGSATKGFHIGHMHLLNKGIVMDKGKVFNVMAFQSKFNGGIAYKRITKTADYQIQEYDYLIGVLTGDQSVTGSLTMTLPDANICEVGQNFIIKDESGNANNHNIIIKTNDFDTIDGLSSIILQSPYSSVNIYTNGIGKFFIH